MSRTPVGAFAGRSMATLPTEQMAICRGIEPLTTRRQRVRLPLQQQTIDWLRVLDSNQRSPGYEPGKIGHFSNPQF